MTVTNLIIPEEHSAMTKPTPPARTGATQPVIATEVVLPGVVEPAGLQLRHRPLPAPERGQALVRVEATGISFAEQGMRRGRYAGQPKFPFVPGYDLVGTVDAVGDAADGRWWADASPRPPRPGAGPATPSYRSPTWCRCLPAWTRLRPRPWSSTASPPTRCCTASPRSSPGRRSWSTAPAARSAPYWCNWPATTVSTSSAPRPHTTTPRCATSESPRWTTTTPTSPPRSATWSPPAWLPSGSCLR